ncbi:hypothetical protein SAMN05444279_12236 [Ruegeria intermedia]|uniref:TadE-like domain-containing protein n=1 Tax=Ruegeria intermedia TaxID=996115 RepID=A0A1M4ZXL4_9RHOB|nr:TadE/TadG family type IV pilus assembly protein [Ruegeria intermedia]SHF22793.1 hypothetical protein SAMN05444279_12236 [Ruegeria intermedia]
MIRKLLSKFRLFRRNEGGMATIEFIFWFPIFVGTTYSAVEVGIGAFNHANLERALDETIRDVRLNNLAKYTTNVQQGWTHDLLKEIVCDKAAFIPDCDANLALELTRVDPYSGHTLSTRPYCADTPATIQQNPIFNPGGSDELMIVRACVEVNPLWAGSILGWMTSQRDNGQYELHATTVFVYEPT